MPTWWLTDAAMFNPVCAHHVRAGRSWRQPPPVLRRLGVEEGLKPCRTGSVWDCLTVYEDEMGCAEPYGISPSTWPAAPYDARPQCCEESWSPRHVMKHWSSSSGSAWSTKRLTWRSSAPQAALSSRSRERGAERPCPAHRRCVHAGATWSTRRRSGPRAPGSADFLLRVTVQPVGLSLLRRGRHQARRKMKVAALLQMADYGRHLQRLQGNLPSAHGVTVMDRNGVSVCGRRRYARRATASSGPP